MRRVRRQHRSIEIEVENVESVESVQTTKMMDTFLKVSLTGF